jgi:hypothetical protein
MVIMRYAVPWVLVLLTGHGCGPSVDLPMSGSSTSAETTSDTLPTGGSMSPLDGSSSGSTGSPSSSGGDQDDSSSTSSSSTGDGGTLGDTSTGEPVGPITYCVDAWGDAYYRTRIWRRDETANLCILVRLIDGPMTPEEYALDVPAPWALEFVALFDDAAVCGTNVSSNVDPSAAEGTVEIIDEDPAPYAELAGIDATLYFDPVEPWIPEQVIMQIEPLPVQKSCETGRWVPGP